MSIAAANAGETIRIEPRPVYGATITLEEGVRVFRALPPERRVIVNPGNAPISLGFNETTINERRTVYNHFAGAPGSYGGRYYSGFAGGYGYGGYGYGRGYGPKKLYGGYGPYQKSSGVPGYGYAPSTGGRYGFTGR